MHVISVREAEKGFRLPYLIIQAMKSNIFTIRQWISLLEDVIEARNLIGWKQYEGYNEHGEILKDIEHLGAKQLSSAKRLNFERQVVPVLITVGFIDHIWFYTLPCRLVPSDLHLLFSEVVPSALRKLPTPSWSALSHHLMKLISQSFVGFIKAFPTSILSSRK